ncbi:MAG: D-2-hydroxyacid dehydrogenase [Ramlibacter sp.]
MPDATGIREGVRMKVVFGGPIARPQVLEVLRQFPGVDVLAVDEADDVCPHVGDADVLVIANPRDKGRHIAEALGSPACRVKWVQMVSAGTEGLTAHPLPPHIPITNQGGAAAPAVAEHAMGLLLALTHRLDVALKNQAAASWNVGALRPLLQSVEGMTVGVIGMGNIGRELALRLRAFGATVHGFSRSGESNEAADAMHRIAELKSQVSSLDALVVCVALVPQTRHLVDAELLSLCRKTAYVINIARGESVDSLALDAALREGRIAGAGLDVTDPEPLPADHPLWTAPNLILTPHTAPMGNKLVGRRVAAVVRENMQRFLEGRELLHRVEL